MNGQHQNRAYRNENYRSHNKPNHRRRRYNWIRLLNNPRVLFIAAILCAIFTFFNFRAFVRSAMGSLADFIAENLKPNVNITFVTPRPNSEDMNPVSHPSASDSINVVPTPLVNEYNYGYTSENVNVRQFPSKDGEILFVCPSGIQLEYIDCTSEWVEVRINDTTGYIFSKYIVPGQLDYISCPITSNGFKSYMGYKTITAKSSLQYKLQSNYAFTGMYGIRTVKGRFCIAVGSGVGAPIGTYVDLVLENGTVIPCIVADQKADCDTADDNITTVVNGCVSEFIVDMTYLDSNIKTMGDVSYANLNWRSPVSEIRVYDINFFTKP